MRDLFSIQVLIMASGRSDQYVTYLIAAKKLESAISRVRRKFKGKKDVLHEIRETKCLGTFDGIAEEVKA